MIGVLKRRTYLDTDTYTRKIMGRHREKAAIYKPDTDFSLTALRRNQLCPHLGHSLLASRMMKKKKNFCSLSSSRRSTCYGNPSKLINGILKQTVFQ